jgi:hypothetical protein
VTFITYGGPVLSEATLGGPHEPVYTPEVLASLRELFDTYDRACCVTAGIYLMMHATKSRAVPSFHHFCVQSTAAARSQGMSSARRCPRPTLSTPNPLQRSKQQQMTDWSQERTSKARRLISTSSSSSSVRTLLFLWTTVDGWVRSCAEYVLELDIMMTRKCLNLNIQVDQS